MKEFKLMKDIDDRVRTVVATIREIELPAAREIFDGVRKPTPLKPKVMRFYERVDALWNFESESQPIACAKGCSYCCHYYVLVRTSEVLALAEAIQALPDSLLTELKDRIAHTVKLTASMNADEYKASNVPCALLKDGLCSVYESRPLTCRTHHSADVGVCARTHENPTQPEQSQYRPIRYAVGIATEMALSHAQQKQDTDDSKYELHAALYEALSASTGVSRWRDGKVAFPNVKNRVPAELSTDQNK